MGLSSATAICVVIVVLVILVWAWKLLNWLWLRPKKLERLLRAQGFQGSPYKLLGGDSVDTWMKMMAAKSQQPMSLSNDKDIAPRIFSVDYHLVDKFGKSSFYWEGQTPNVIISDPKHIKEIFNDIYHFKKEKPKVTRVAKLLGSGLPNYEGQQWQKHRKIINPAFHAEKLKLLSSTMIQCCDDVISKWEGMLSFDGKCDIDVWPFIQDLACDVISRTAFGSSYEDGKRIFELLKMQGGLVMKLGNLNIPGWWLLPTAVNRRLTEIDREIETSIEVMVNKREKAMKTCESMDSDLLGLLLESNHREIKEHGNDKTIGMTSREIIEECNTFYFAGQETTADLLVWTMVLLSRYPDWQAHARKEVLQVFGNQKPNTDGLGRLKIVSIM